MKNPRTLLAVCLVAWLAPGLAWAQDEEAEPPVSVNGSMQLQTGWFMPLFSDGFKPQKNVAKSPGGEDCDPVRNPTAACVPSNHGKGAGSLSMGRSVFLLEGDWTANSKTSLHAILRAVRSLSLEADEWAAVPVMAADPSERREASQDWVHDQYYTEFDLREMYLDTQPFKWLSLRLGRQQIAWGETGQYRLLDVINPSNETWHFGPLESFEDTRIPLWMAKSVIDFRSIDQSLELVWAPLFLDRPEDTVTVPLTFVSAWGLPLSNTPSSFYVENKIFKYPGGEPKDMRGGARWRGNLATDMSFTLAYFYTHQLSVPIPEYFEQRDPTTVQPGSPDPVGTAHIQNFVLGFPRQHIFGGSLEYAFESPIGMVARLEVAVEKDHTYPRLTTPPAGRDPNNRLRYLYDINDETGKETAISYAVVLQRPTMIRFLNPTQNFLIVAQFMHTFLPTLTKYDRTQLVEVPGFNKMFVEQNQMKLVLAIATNYMNGLITPKLVGVFVLPDSGFYTLDLAFRLGEYWRARLAFTDFLGKDPYKGVGLFRDRDEINLGVTCLF